MMLMIRTQIQLTEDQAARLKRVAATRGVSMATLIREAVERSFQEEDATLRRDRAIAAIGGFRSGYTDVSVRHDEHLVEAFGS